MTIAAGLIGTGGFVMCADTKEIYPDAVKIDTGKLTVHVNQTGTYVITGATNDADVLETAMARVMHKLGSEEYRIHRLGWSGDSILLEDAIREVMAEIREECILPFPLDQQPWLNILLGVARRGVTGLFKVTPRTVVPIRWYDCVGVGIVQAKALLDRFHEVQLTRYELEILAIYIMRLVKKYVPDVEGFTHLVSVDLFGGYKWWPVEDVVRMESKLAEFDDFVRDVLALLSLRPGCTGNQFAFTDFSKAGDTLGRFRDEIWAIAGPLEDKLEQGPLKRSTSQKSED